MTRTGPLMDASEQGGPRRGWLPRTAAVLFGSPRLHPIELRLFNALTLMVTAAMFMAEYRHPEWFGGVGTPAAGWSDRFGNFIFVQLLIAVLVTLLVSNLEVERRKADALLLNVLPESLADELKKYRRAAPKSVPVATVLFSDIVGFTASAEKTSPDDLVAEWSRLGCRGGSTSPGRLWTVPDRISFSNRAADCLSRTVDKWRCFWWCPN